MTGTELITFFIAIGGWVVALLTTILNYRQKIDEIFFQSLDWLSGGTQKRNLGIAAIEANWDRSRFRQLCVPLLINSAIYLIAESDQADSANELNNLYRMIRLLFSYKRLPPKYHNVLQRFATRNL